MPALQNDLTQGSVSRKLIRYAMPLVASSLLQAIYSITDIIIAGHFIGDNGISAINTSSVIMNMLTQLAIGVTATFWSAAISAAAPRRTAGKQRAIP